MINRQQFPEWNFCKRDRFFRLTHLIPLVAFYNNLRFSYVLKGYRKRLSAWNRLKENIVHPIPPIINQTFYQTLLTNQRFTKSHWQRRNLTKKKLFNFQQVIVCSGKLHLGSKSNSKFARGNRKNVQNLLKFSNR